jgi:hypothetical protein
MCSFALVFHTRGHDTENPKKLRDEATPHLPVCRVGEPLTFPPHHHRRIPSPPPPPPRGPPMGFFRRIAGFLGISRDDFDHPDSSASNAAHADEFPPDRVAAAAAQGTRRGFSVQVPVPVERQGPVPVLVPCPQGDGGVQVARLLYRVRSCHQLQLCCRVNGVRFMERATYRMMFLVVSGYLKV